MQIIIPTAQSLVRDTPYEPTRETLMRPAVAVELGTKYLAKLLARHKVIPLASAGYNAGGGAVGKWRRQFGDVDVDEFVERIPYREAHLYAKSVTQTLARYLWLYEGELLVLDLRPVGHPDAAAQPTE
jgi:soluble lytic murein transglycosylase